MTSSLGSNLHISPTWLGIGLTTTCGWLVSLISSQSLSQKTLYPLNSKLNSPFSKTGEDSLAPGEQVGEEELGRPTLGDTSLNQPILKAKIPAHVINSTGEIAQGVTAHTHTSVQIVGETTHMHGVKRNNNDKVNNVKSYAQPQQQQKTGVAAPNDLKRVHTAGDIGINKVASLCARS